MLYTTTSRFNSTSLQHPSTIKKLAAALSEAKQRPVDGDGVLVKNRKGKVFAVVQFFRLSNSFQISEYNGDGVLVHKPVV